MSVIREALSIYLANWDDYNGDGHIESTFEEVEEAIRLQATYEAAPELLGALKSLLFHATETDNPAFERHAERARAAIAKAEVQG